MSGLLVDLLGEEAQTIDATVDLPFYLVEEQVGDSTWSAQEMAGLQTWATLPDHRPLAEKAGPACPVAMVDRVEAAEQLRPHLRLQVEEAEEDRQVDRQVHEVTPHPMDPLLNLWGPQLETETGADHHDGTFRIRVFPVPAVEREWSVYAQPQLQANRHLQLGQVQEVEGPKLLPLRGEVLALAR